MNILLVEDEPPILRELEHYIRKFGEPYEIIATASDGQRAKELIDEYQDRIDYLLTDIQIPMMNGLELVEYVKNHYPAIICSILTGFNDFSYVQKGLRLKIHDYILKPIEEDILRKQLKDVYEHKCLDCAKSEIITGYSGTPSFSDELYLNYRQLLVNIGQFSNRAEQLLDEAAASKDSGKLESKLHQFQNRFSKYWIIRDKNCRTYFILFSFNKKQLRECHAFYYELYEALSRVFPMITVIPSDTRITLDNISNSIQNQSKSIYKNILFAQSSFIPLESRAAKSEDMLALASDKVSSSTLIRCKYRSSDSGLASDKVSSPSLQESAVPVDSIMQLCKLFNSGSREMFHSELYAFINQLKFRSLKQKTLATCLLTLFTECTVPYLHYNSIQQIEPYKIIDDIIMLSGSYESLYTNLVSIFDDILATIVNETGTMKGKSSTFVQVNDYIKKHYADAINTKTIADKFGFTPAYLSKLFREYKEITPSEYISLLRIGKAKELLKNCPALSVREIAAVTGYDDPLYFSKVFKKLVGVTPKTYQTEQDR